MLYFILLCQVHYSSFCPIMFWISFITNSVIVLFFLWFAAHKFRAKVLMSLTHYYNKDDRREKVDHNFLVNAFNITMKKDSIIEDYFIIFLKKFFMMFFFKNNIIFILNLYTLKYKYIWFVTKHFALQLSFINLIIYK